MIKKIITIYSPMSCGATDTAIDIATQLGKYSKRVCLLDWNLLRPRIREKLKIKSEHGIQELVEHVRDHKLEDKNFLRSFVKIKNIFVLFGLYNLNDIYHIREEHIITIIETLKKHFEYIVIDVNNYHDFYPTVIALEQCDKMLVVTSGDLINLKETRRYLDMFFKYDDIKKEKVDLLVNRYGGHDLLKNEIKMLYGDMQIFYAEKERHFFKSNKNNNSYIEKFMRTIIKKGEDLCRL